VELSPSPELFPFSHPPAPLRRRGPAYARPCRFRAAGLPLLGFLLPRTHYAGCPFSPRRPEGRLGGRGSPDPRRCRPQGSCPSRRFWLRSRHVRIPCESRRLRGVPTLRGLVPCRSRPWSCPPELSLPEEPYPLSRAVASLQVSLADHRRRRATGIFTIAFAAAPALCPNESPGGDPWTHEP